MRLLVAGAALLSGCSLLVPLDATSGGDAPDASAESGADATSTTPVDGSTIDAAVDADSGRTLDCPNTALLCDDFERADIEIGGPWKAFAGGTPGAISTKHASSPTRSATFKLPADGNVPPYYEKTLAQAVGHLVVAFDVLLEKPVTSGYVELVKPLFGPVNDWDAFAIQADAEGLAYSADRYDGSATPAYYDSRRVLAAANLYDGAFHHVVVDIDVRGSTTKRIAVTVDGQAAAPFDLPSTHTNDTPVDLLFGITYATATTYDGVYFDDFVVTEGP